MMLEFVLWVLYVFLMFDSVLLRDVMFMVGVMFVRVCCDDNCFETLFEVLEVMFFVGARGVCDGSVFLCVVI